ncbi:MAG: DUF86 domain-containing protein [Chloroflexi bacterium CFX4]|nr:DUF86 domain-containing protein [Chloroflexi bacterium CFX4]MDL1923529.1 DUF86 domain-containing protein [Chloroflexi bacterium CFX3]
MNENDRIRLQHMYDAAYEARSFAAGKTREALDADRGLVLILTQLIMIIGEAAARISEETRLAHPNVAWRAIVGMRNHLVHAYFDVDLDIIWNTIANRIPELLETLAAILETPSKTDT